MTHRDLLKAFFEKDIPFVVIGGVAMRIYNSPRVTYDIDIAARILDSDAIVDLLYGRDYFIIEEVTDKDVRIPISPQAALEWVEKTRTGALSFMKFRNPPKDETVPVSDIDLATQVDILFEPGIPFFQLLKRAQIIDMQDFSFSVASAGDMLELKTRRPDKTEADLDDIRFLKRLLGRGE